MALITSRTEEWKLIHLFRSGTEEQYTEVHQLLDDIQSYLEDLEQSSDQSKRKKNDQDKQKAHEMRNASMETLKRSNEFEINC